MESVHHGRLVPTVPVARSMNLAAVAAAREQAAPRPSWTAVFIRAYGLVARHCPELRQALMTWPYTRLYEHPHSTCALVVEREWQGETVLLAAKIRAPEDMSLATIQRCIRRFKEAPVRDISEFRTALRLGRLPWFLRRFAIWQTLHVSGAKRAKRMGTFMLSSYGGLGAEQLHPIAPFTTLLTFGPISPAGNVVVKLIYDHRVLDGGRIARCLHNLERVLHTDMVQELTCLGRSPQVA